MLRLSFSFCQQCQLSVLFRFGPWEITCEWPYLIFVSKEDISRCIISNITNNKSEIFVQVLSIRASFCIYCVIYRLNRRLNQLVVFFTQFGDSSHCLTFDKFRHTASLNYWKRPFRVWFRLHIWPLKKTILKHATNSRN